MSVTLEQVERLRAHAAVSYEEARRALEACDGDLLDALILLEREGRIPPGGGRGAFFTTQPGAAPEPPPSGPTRGPEASGKDEKRFWGLAVTAGGHRGREERGSWRARLRELLAAALDLLKQKRKRLEQEQKKTLAGLEKRKEELETKISVFTEECRQSEENLQQAREQMKRDIYQKDVPIERVRKMKKESRKSRKWGAACVALAGFLLFLCILQFFHIDSLLTRTGLGLAIAALLYLAYSLFRHRKTEVEQVVTEPEEQAIRRQQWNVDRLKQELGQKQTVLSNLQSEYEELCISMTEKDHLQEELDALSLAGETIQSLSVQMQSRIGDRLKQQMSKTLSSLTNGRYLQVNMDENLRIGLHTADEYVPLEQVSRGTIEQAYFALRMAAMDVLCGEEELPVILDESFAFYDENRLKETLKWLAENRTQVLLFTCQKREEEALSEMGIPYRKIVL